MVDAGIVIICVLGEHNYFSLRLPLRPVLIHNNKIAVYTNYYKYTLL